MAGRPVPDYPPRRQDLMRDLGIWWDTTINLLFVLVIAAFSLMCVGVVVYGFWYLLTL